MGVPRQSLGFTNCLLKDEILKIIFESPPIYPFERLCDAILSRNKNHSFLEIYRTLEGLFGHSRILKMLKEIKCKCDVIKYCKLLYDQLGWKERESEAINSLFCEAKDYLYPYQSYKNISKHQDTAKISNDIYKIRNNIVHFRVLSNKLDLDDNEWCCIIETLLGVTHFWYSKLYKEMETKIQDCVFSCDSNEQISRSGQGQKLAH